MPSRSGVNRYITPSVPPGSVTPRMMRMIIKTHMSGTATRTVFSIVSVPFQRARSVRAHTATTASMGHHEARSPKK